MQIRETDKPSQFLRMEFNARKRRNPAYSLRSFARDLGMSASLLSMVLNDQRPLTLRQAHKVSVVLRMTSQRQREFLNGTLLALPENAKLAQRLRAQGDSAQVLLTRSIDVDTFQFISRPCHFAILELTTTVDFRRDDAWIAKRLGLTRTEVKEAITRMLDLGFLVVKNGRLQKASLHLEWVPKESRAAFRAFHDEMIQKARDELKNTDQESYDRRWIAGTTLALDPSRIQEAKAALREYERDFVQRFTTGDPREVYQINFQFFPLSKGVES